MYEILDNFINQIIFNLFYIFIFPWNHDKEFKDEFFTMIFY